jgi:hypothetical protein
LEKRESIVVSAAVGLVIYTLALTVLGPAISAAVANRTVSNTGTVKAVGVGVYWDQAATNSVSSINWGILDPGSNVNKTVYIRNEGNTASTLAMSASNWSPSNASTYMTLSWNYGGQTVNVNQVVQVKFTLAVSSNISGITNFSFDITITATGQ